MPAALTRTIERLCGLPDLCAKRGQTRVAPRVTVITLPRLVLWFLPCAGGVAVDGVALSRPSE